MIRSLQQNNTVIIIIIIITIMIIISFRLRLAVESSLFDDLTVSHLGSE